MKRKTNSYLAIPGLIIATILLSHNYYVDSASAYTASITTGSSISLDVTPGGNGTSIHSESINVTSNCRSGYDLTIATPSGSNLYEGGDNTKSAAFTAVDGTSALNSSSNTNKWGYTLTADATSSTVFSPLSTTASVLKTSSQTASATDIDDTFNIYYGVKVDGSVSPGTYQMASNGSIVYYLTMNTACANYTVNYNANGGTNDNPGGSSTYIQELGVGEIAKLTQSAFTAPTTGSYTDADNNTITGDPDKLWTFWGWNTEVDGTGDWYKDQEEVTNLLTTSGTINLYAQWKQATLADMVAGTASGTEKVIDHNLIQDMTPAACYNSPITTAADAPAATLLDYRGKVTTGATPESPESYTVSKLADGLCWMTTNLNLGRTGTDGPNGDGTVTLTSDDTDLAENTTFTLPAGDTTSYTGTTNLAKVRLTNNSGTNANGAYYSWAAAVANTNSIDTNPTTSICAKNWDLPTSVQYANLKTRANYKTGNLTTSAPSSFLINGGFTNGSSFYQTGYSHFWTSTSYNSSRAFGARVDSININTSSSAGTTYGGNKYYRKNLRCVASQGKATINYDGNGTTEYPVTGTTASQENVEISSANTQANGFTRTGWGFNGWNTAADGSGTAIAASTAISTLNLAPSSTITLYAQWLPQYTITYVNNCQTYASANSSCTQSVSDDTSEQKINLTNDPSTGTETGTLANYNNNNTWNLTGWKITGWSTVANNSDNTNTEYKVSSTYTVPSGSSAGSGITLYAHWAHIYTVQYDGNGSDNDSTGMGSTDATTGIKTVAHTNVAEGDTFDLFASNFKKAGYGFVGWSTDSDAWTKLTDNDTSNDAKIWGPNEVITAPAYNGTPITTLYAIWAPAETSGGNPVYLQNWTGCSAMTATTYDTTTGTLTVAKDSITALTDQRDNQVYTIAKLADENCWMVENLRLDNTPELSTTNTNIDSSNSTLPITNEYGSTTSNYLSATSSSWCTTNSAACDDQSRLNTTNTIANVTPSQTQNVTSANAHTNFNNTIYSYGNYYNWYSATAGYGTYSRTTSEPTAGDLCPAGWKLPYGNTGTSGANIGGTKGGFSYLDKQMGGSGSSQSISANKWRMFPNNFIYSGFWNGSSAGNRGYYGYYWSASANVSNFAYYLGLRSTYVYPGDYSNDKYNGYSVRCVASPAS